MPKKATAQEKSIILIRTYYISLKTQSKINSTRKKRIRLCLAGYQDTVVN